MKARFIFFSSYFHLFYGLQFAEDDNSIQIDGNALCLHDFSFEIKNFRLFFSLSRSPILEGSKKPKLISIGVLLNTLYAFIPIEMLFFSSFECEWGFTKSGKYTPFLFSYIFSFSSTKRKGFVTKAKLNIWLVNHE